MNYYKFFFNLKFLVMFLVAFLLINLLIACGEVETPTALPFQNKTTVQQITTSSSTTPVILPSSTSTTLDTGADTSADAAVPTPTPPAQLIGPTVGANGQITVNAPPADGKNVSGHYYWIKSGSGTEIWEGGTGSGKPLDTSSLGGQSVLKVDDGALAKDPMLSPDNTKLAYSYSPPPYKDTQGNIIFGADIYLLDLSTKKTQLLVKRAQPEEFLEFPAWSSDGQTLFFASRSPHRENNRVTGTELSIGKFDIKSQQRVDLTKDGSEPVPLPDGKSLVYIGIMASDDSYSQSLRIFDFQTGKSKMLASEAQNFYGFRAPRPSPDGQTIVFGGIGGPDEVPLNTTSASSNKATTPAPTVKKSGDVLNSLGALSFGLLGGLSSNSNGNGKSATNPLDLPELHGLPYDLWEIKPGGGDLHRITSLFEDEPVAAWSKDGKNLLFIAGNGLYTVNRDGSNLSKKSNEGAHGGFTWQP